MDNATVNERADMRGNGNLLRNQKTQNEIKVTKMLKMLSLGY